MGEIINLQTAPHKRGHTMLGRLMLQRERRVQKRELKKRKMNSKEKSNKQKKKTRELNMRSWSPFACAQETPVYSLESNFFVKTWFVMVCF